MAHGGILRSAVPVQYIGRALHHFAFVYDFDGLPFNLMITYTRGNDQYLSGRVKVPVAPGAGFEKDIT